MRNHHRAASEFQQGLFQGAQGFDVQVVRGFVEHEHVAALGQGLGQVQTTTLTTGEVFHQLLLVVAFEVEAADVGAAGHHELAHGDVVQTAGDVFPHGLVAFQAFAALVHKSQLGGLTHGDAAAVGRLNALDHAEQGGLARAVGADDAADGTGGQLEAELVHEQAVAKALGNVLKFNDLRTQALGHGNEDLVGLVALLVFDVAQLFEARHAGLALGLAAFGVAAHPLQFFLHGLGAGVFALLFLGQALFFLLEPVGVVAFPWNAVATVQFQDPFSGVVQEVAVVGDGHHGARETLQELLEPMHRLGVQVVGRFVEQKHVGLGEQQAAQRYAALFTAGEVLHHRIPSGQVQRVGGQLQLQVGILRPAGRNDGLQFGLFGGEGVKVGAFFGVSGVDLVQALLRSQGATDALLHRLAHGLVGIELWLLRQVTDLDAGHGGGFAVDFFVHTRHDFEQGRLARTVEAQHADLGAGEERQGHVLQDLALGWHRLADAVHRKNVLSH